MSKIGFGEISRRIILSLFLFFSVYVGFGFLPATAGIEPGLSDKLPMLAEIRPEAKTLGTILVQEGAGQRETQAAKHPKLGSAVAFMLETYKTSPTKAIDQARLAGMNISEDLIQVYVVTHPDGVQKVTRIIEGANGKISRIGAHGTLMQAWVPVDALEAIAENEDVYYIRRPDLVRIEEDLIPESAMTEGLSAMNATAWYGAGYTGAGVKIGVIDVGFQGYASLLGTELPASVTVKNFVDSETDAQVDGTTEHGTACAEIIHDVAPGAELYLAKVSTTLDIEEAANWLRDTCQVDIISTSLSSTYTAPGDGTGFLADVVKQARNAGILWATAAGNEREKHWAGQFYDPNRNGSNNFSGDWKINYFGPGDGSYWYRLSAGQTITVTLRWDDWTAVNQDYDVHIVRWNGSSWKKINLYGGEERQDGTPGKTPREEAIAITTGDPTAYGFAIVRYNATRDVNFDAIVSVDAGVPPEFFMYERSLPNLADAPDAITVAAVDVNSPYPQEYYSSEGPTNGPGGTPTGGFIKPDIAAYANVSTVSYGLSSFAGTSAATPHVAGAAALVLSAYPSYTPDQIQTFLESRAIDQGVAGKDTQYGSGRLYLGTPPEQGLWGDAVDLGGGWKWLSWFGYFNVNNEPWIYHQEHEWLYPFGETTASIVFWDAKMGAFWWTSDTVYPNLYRFSDGAWLWYQVGSKNPRWFYNYKTSRWERG